MGATTAAYISAHSSDARYAVGGPAAAADPAATPLGRRLRAGARAALAHPTGVGRGLCAHSGIFLSLCVAETTFGGLANPRSDQSNRSAGTTRTGNG